MVAMNKKIISKVGKRHRPEIDMMEYIQLGEVREFDLDKHKPKKITFEERMMDYADPSNPVKKNSVDIEHNDQLVEEIENNEV